MVAPRRLLNAEPILGVGDLGQFGKAMPARSASFNVLDQDVSLDRAQGVGRQSGEQLVGGTKRHRAEPAGTVAWR
jgi:hypothetical protein